MGGLDWSQPVVKLKDDELNLDWGDDKEDDEEEDDDNGLTMKKTEPQTKGDGGSESSGSKQPKDELQVGIKCLRT